MLPPYILGLWCGDKYWRSSSVGLSNVSPVLINKFKEFFAQYGFPTERIKLSVYLSKDNECEVYETYGLLHKNVKTYSIKKAKKINYIIYVNSRDLKRRFEGEEKEVQNAINNRDYLLKYIAGRTDADGYFDKRKLPRLRIAYTSKEEAEIDKELISKFCEMNADVKKYRNYFVLEMCGWVWKGFIDEIKNNCNIKT